jgi:hypothetical protein
MKQFIILVIGIGLGYLGGRFHKEIAAFIKKVVDKMRSSAENNASEDNQQYDRDKAKEEFIRVAEKFSGIYGALYLVASDPLADKADVLNDWNSRVKYLNNAANFQKFWAENQSDLNTVIAFFKECGILRDERKSFIAEENTKYRYLVIQESRVEVGCKYEVVLPCWLMDDKVLEKGTLKLI